MEAKKRKQIIEELEGLVGFITCPKYIKDAFALIKALAKDYTELDEKYRKLYEENASLICIKHLLEQDIEDRDKMLESKVEEVYPEFMKDYGLMREELDACYEENGKLRVSLTNTTEAYDFVNGVVLQTRADTVREMQTEIEARCLKGGIYPAFVKSTIDKIADEMIGGDNADKAD